MVVVGTWNLENLFRPGGEFGPTDDAAFRAKLAAIADTISQLAPDVLGGAGGRRVCGTERPCRLLPGDWHTAVSSFPDSSGIRVGFLSRHPLGVVADAADFPEALAPFQADDSGALTTRMGRGALAVSVEPVSGLMLTVVTCHLKSKLLTFPSGRFSPHDEGERARYGAYALYRRAAEAVTIRDLADQLIDGHGQDRPVIVLGDLNDDPQAGSTQILLGPPGSELGTAGANRPDLGDAWRLWNLAPLLPADQQYSRIYRGRGELIDHILISHALVDRVEQVRSIVGRPLPSIEDNPNERRDAFDSDHAPVLVQLRT